MNTTDTPDIDEELANHLRRTLRSVAATVTDDDAVDLNLRTIPPSQRRRRRTSRIVLVGAAAALLVGAVAILRATDASDLVTDEDDQAENPDEPTQDPPAPAPADGAPRLLMTAEGWTVDSVQEITDDYGEISFAGPEGELSLTWGTDSNGGYQDRMEEWADSPRLDDMSIAGAQAAVFQPGYGGDTYDVVAVWEHGRFGVELRGPFTEIQTFLDLAATLQTVEEDTWLAALPDVAVRSEEEQSVVEEMLADIPLPAGFDTTRVDTDDDISGRYQFGADVTGAVVCAWTEQWLDARESGDTAAAQEAVDAMATSPDWDILVEMDAEGGWSDSVWEWAGAMATDGPFPGGSENTRPEDVYEESFGCTR